ncbi:MAG: DUF4440 domain-containing protein [Pyrinomonadaceae bacterium]
MKVTFTRTAERRYRVSVEGPGVVSSWMEPAPGYDARLPHDMAHFVVENELGISGGEFGQLAAGGNARTFKPTAEQSRRKLAKRGNRIATTNRDDASIDNDEVMVRVYGDAAVVTGRSTTKRAGQGSEVITRQVRFTRVYAKSKGRWRAVSAHNTLIRQQ